MAISLIARNTKWNNNVYNCEIDYFIHYNLGQIQTCSRPKQLLPDHVSLEIENICKNLEDFNILEGHWLQEVQSGTIMFTIYKCKTLIVIFLVRNKIVMIYMPTNNRRSICNSFGQTFPLVFDLLLTLYRNPILS